MGDAATYATELAVGVATLVAALGARRSAAPGWLALALAVAGLAACVHALVRLST